MFQYECYPRALFTRFMALAIVCVGLFVMPDYARAQCTGECVNTPWSRNGSPVVVRLGSGCMMAIHFQARFCVQPTPLPTIYEVFFDKIEILGTSCNPCSAEFQDVVTAVRTARDILWNQNPLAIPYGNTFLRIMYPHCWQEINTKHYQACSSTDPCCKVSGTYTQFAQFTQETPAPTNNCVLPCVYVCTP